MDREADWKVAPQYFAQGTCAVYTISSEQGAFPKRWLLKLALMRVWGTKLQTSRISHYASILEELVYLVPGLAYSAKKYNHTPQP